MNKIKEYWIKKNLAPPQTILRRMLSFPIITVGRILFVTGVFLGWGWDMAVRWWKNTEG